MKFVVRIATKMIRILSFIKVHLLSFRHSLDLKLGQNNLDSIKPGDIILFSVMKNETRRLEFFLDYYRKLGVNHFVFIDNMSSDGFTNFVSSQGDVTTYYTAASYKGSNFGVYWLNHLLAKHGTGHWCLTCDPDEFFVYPKIDSRNLRELTEYLGANYLSSFYTLMVDMYGRQAIEDTEYSVGQDPLEVCPYLDRNGYTKSYWNFYSAASANGGVRRRVFFKASPEVSPVLNKVPLIKWERHFVYILSTHVARPNHINDVCDLKHMTGALLHFKFISDLKGKVEEEKHAKQHWNDSIEYKKYGEILESKTQLFDEDISREYRDWHTLADLGLINIGDW